MNIREQLVQLSELGRCDLKIKELQDQRVVLQKKAEEAQQQGAQFSQREAQLAAKNAELLTQKRQVDLELGTERGNLRKWEGRAEKIRGEREYAALMSEIGTQKRAITNFEEKLQVLNKELEISNKELLTAQNSAKESNQRAEQEWANVREALEALEQQMKQTKQNREALSKNLPAPLFKRYEQIASRRAGVGVAVVSREVCQACSRTIPPELFIRVFRGELIEQCPSCQRFLVTEDMTSVTAEVSEQ